MNSLTFPTYSAGTSTSKLVATIAQKVVASSWARERPGHTRAPEPKWKKELTALWLNPSGLSSSIHLSGMKSRGREKFFSWRHIFLTMSMFRVSPLIVASVSAYQGRGRPSSKSPSLTRLLTGMSLKFVAKMTPAGPCVRRASWNTPAQYPSLPTAAELPGIPISSYSSPPSAVPLSNSPPAVLASMASLMCLSASWRARERTPSSLPRKYIIHAMVLALVSLPARRNVTQFPNSSASLSLSFSCACARIRD
mmetsp:Transcript_1608/g.5677  ORF Transcript_1608/g.5677 Transcript_1608/m.5677 type:complete len:252 (-) Transcript_1608:320-1075(-)